MTPRSHWLTLALVGAGLPAKAAARPPPNHPTSHSDSLNQEVTPSHLYLLQIGLIPLFHFSHTQPLALRMHHPMAIGTQQRQIRELSFVTRLERVQRFSVVYINHPLHICTIGLAEIKTTRLTLQCPMLLQRLFLLRLTIFLSLSRTRCTRVSTLPSSASKKPGSSAALKSIGLAGIV